MSQATFYPPSPTALPENFTKLPSSYKLKASLAIGAIIMFVLLYAALVVTLGWLTYYAFTYDIEHINKFTILLKIGAIAGAGMLLAFTVKFIFKLKNTQPVNRIKIDLEKNPKLKHFVMQICKETGAPKPKNVYVDPDVNAYVSYSNMWMSLFLPTRKNLTIGLGLVGCLNLSEFKAVVAHEFGHFSQRSMKIGSYIISANTIIHDMIYSRDSWDDLLDRWRGSDIRLSVFAWIITPIIWVVRQILALFYQLLNLAYGSLSREMEFNADKVAVMTAGSEGIISSLWMLNYGFSTWSNTIDHAYLASQKDLAVKNLYIHNDQALSSLNKKISNALEDLPKDDHGRKMFFSSSENAKVSMYASHPPNHDRENNAKTPFIPCEHDQRSSWLLLDEKEKIQEQVTELIYSTYIGKKPPQLLADNEFQDFVKAESAGKELLEEYQNTFRDRFVSIPEEKDLKAAEIQIQVKTLTLSEIKKELFLLMEPVGKFESQLKELQSMAAGESRNKFFEYQGKTYKKKNINEVYDKLVKDREDYFNSSFKDWDAQFFAFHFRLANSLNRSDELLDYYRQHRRLNSFYMDLVYGQKSIYSYITNLQSQSEVTQEVINEVELRIQSHFQGFNYGLSKFDEIKFVPLPNIHDVQELKKSIVDGGNFMERGFGIFKSGKFDEMMRQLSVAINHLQRIDQRSMAVILTIHKELAESKLSIPQTA